LLRIASGAWCVLQREIAARPKFAPLLAVEATAFLARLTAYQAADTVPLYLPSI
jgi:hypothetical protein